MSETLSGRRVAVLAPWRRAGGTAPTAPGADAGAETELLSLELGEVQACNQEIFPAERFGVDRLVSQA